MNNRKMFQKIKDICKQKGIKISDLEEKLGLSTGNLSRWAKSCPTAIEVLYNISTLLNVSSDYLLGIERGSSNQILDECSENRGESIKFLIEATNKRDILWQKIPYSQAKKISVVNITNEIIYKDNFRIYETKTDKGHLILIHESPDINYLYIYYNNEYLLLCDDYYTSILYESVIDVYSKIVGDFFKI